MREPPTVRHEFRRLSLLLFCLYFVQKVCNHLGGLSKNPIRRLLRTAEADGGLGLSAAQAGTFLTATGLGWYLKALLGVITDRLPLFGYRRKSWLILCLVGSGMAWWWMAMFPAPTSATLLISLLTINLFVAFSDVVCDGLMVDNAQRLEHAYDLPAGSANRPLQAAQWQGAFLAVTLSSIGGGLIAQFFDLRIAAIISGCLPVGLAVAVARSTKEPRVRWSWEKARAGFLAVAALITMGTGTSLLQQLPQNYWLVPFVPYLSTVVILGLMVWLVRIPRVLLLPAVFIFCWSAIPFDRNSQYFYQYLVQDKVPFATALDRGELVGPWLLRLSEWFGVTIPSDQLGHTLDFFYGSIFIPLGQLTALFGVIIYRRYWSGAPLVTIFRWCLLISTVEAGWFSIFPIFGVTSIVLLLIGGALAGLALAVALLAAVTYAAAAIPDTDQASAFAFLMGVANLGTMLGVETIGGGLYTHFGMTVAGKVTAPDQGLLAVLLVAFGHLAVLYLIVHLFNRRGSFSVI